MRALLLALLLAACPAPAATGVLFPALAPVSAPANPITQSLALTHSSGVAPLLVWADMTGTTAASLTSLPVQEMEYHFDAGDGTAPNWTNGTRPGTSSNTFVGGPVFAHVFETPGTYNLCGYAVYSVNTSATTCGTVTVTDPATVFSGKTYCYSTAGVFTGCPLIPSPYATSAACVTAGFCITQSNWDTIANARFLSGAGTRVLLHRGETFTTGGFGAIKIAGPGIVGSYDSGALPLIQATQGGNKAFFSLNLGTPSDWRIMDLHLNADAAQFTATASGTTLTVSAVASGSIPTGVAGTGPILVAAGLTTPVTITAQTSGSAGSTGTYTLSGSQTVASPTTMYAVWPTVAIAHGDGVPTVSKMLFVGLTADRLDQGILMTQSGGQPTQNGVLRTTFNMMTQEATYNAGQYYAEMDNNFNAGCCGTAGGNFINQSRHMGLNYGFIVANSFSGNADSGASAMTIRTNGVIDPGYNVVADNDIDAGANFYALSIQAANASDAVPHHTIVERNWLKVKNATSGGPCVGLDAGNYVVLRNNVCDNSGASQAFGFRFRQNIVASTPLTNTYAYNNSFYNSAAGSSFSALRVESGSTFTFTNNLASFPAGTSPVTVNSVGGSGISSTTNTTTPLSQDPLFTGTPPNTVAKWKPTCTGSTYPCAGGTTVPLWSDFNLAAQPATRDIGAWAH